MLLRKSSNAVATWAKVANWFPVGVHNVFDAFQATGITAAAKLLREAVM
jgi:hypothetical protein